MPVNILFAATKDQWENYRAPLITALEATIPDFRLGTDLPAASVDYIIYAPNSDLQDFSGFPRLKAVLNLWAGVDKVLSNPGLTVPLTRMVDEEGLSQGMVEWVAGHVLRHHLGMDAHIVNPDHAWAPAAPPLAHDRRVAILGLGQLGLASARALRGFGFSLAGWSRRQRSVAGMDCYHGEDGLQPALQGAEIVVLLLPATEETENILNAERLGFLAPGAVVINPGRGTLIDDAALIAALEAGHLSHATLDVFRIEPLPSDHPFWAHPKVTVTPHIASETRPASAAKVIARNIRRNEMGQGLLHLVDREAGY